MNNRKKLEIGKKFGLLTVVSDTGEVSKNRRALWNTLCDCGNTKMAEYSLLVSGQVKSCGCLRAPRSEEKKLSTYFNFVSQYIDYSESKNTMKPRVESGDSHRQSLRCEIESDMKKFLQNNQITVL
jgi:hypothetical protein